MTKLNLSSIEQNTIFHGKLPENIQPPIEDDKKSWEYYVLISSYDSNQFGHISTFNQLQDEVKHNSNQLHCFIYNQECHFYFLDELVILDTWGEDKYMNLYYMALVQMHPDDVSLIKQLRSYQLASCPFTNNSFKNIILERAGMSSFQFFVPFKKELSLQSWKWDLDMNKIMKKIR